MEPGASTSVSDGLHAEAAADAAQRAGAAATGQCAERSEIVK
jgi:hypothetical protein